MHFLSSLKYLTVSVRLNDQSQAAGLLFVPVALFC